jgi:hypothetical protein
LHMQALFTSLSKSKFLCSLCYINL